VSSLEKSVYPQAIDFQKNHTELTGYAKARTSVRTSHRPAEKHAVSLGSLAMNSPAVLELRRQPWRIALFGESARHVIAFLWIVDWHESPFIGYVFYHFIEK
jgi:hypothetical protein